MCGRGSKTIGELVKPGPCEGDENKNKKRSSKGRRCERSDRKKGSKERVARQGPTRVGF